MDEAERKKRLQLKFDQEIYEFEERGGFAQVLKDIFNPNDKHSAELDSVYQLKMLCQTFYDKKDKMSTDLIETLDAMANERPKVVQLKKKHFAIEKSRSNVHTDLEWMRIQAERDRIEHFRQIAKDDAFLYYRVLKSI